ncbi:MAG: hypothetical protein Q8K00_17240 [Syntrophales bacterium]|nr:hypothetical protein [Syntrophales bacterium]
MNQADHGGSIFLYRVEFIKFRIEVFIDDVIGRSNQAGTHQPQQELKKEMFMTVWKNNQGEGSPGEHENIFEPVIRSGNLYIFKH